MPETMAHFPPLRLILVVMLGAAVAERSGLFTALMTRAMRGVPTRFLSPAIFLIGLLSHQAAKHRTAQAPGASCACSRSEEHTSELQSLMRISYAVFCLKKKKINTHVITEKTT